MKRKLLLGLTTTPGSDWQEKIRDIDRLGIEEISLFPTFLKIDERKNLYKLLGKTKLRNIPHVHLRDDMEDWELDLFDNKYNTEVYNIHPQSEDLILIKKIKNRDQIFVENLEKITDSYFEIVGMCGGICLDIAHWEDEGITEGYDVFSQEINKYKIGCSHISAIKQNYQVWQQYATNETLTLFSDHHLDNFEELDYVKRYVKYLPKYVSIELENSFEEQLKIMDYLKKIIN
jgi:hypothetical protein